MRTMRSTITNLVAVSVLAVAAFSVIGALPAHAADVPATIQSYAFNPSAITVAVGDTVTWTNEDKAPHTVTSTDGGPLDSPTLQQGDTWSFTFTQPGTYKYYCAIHPDMVGTVTVTGSSPPPTTCSSDGTVAAVLDPFMVHLDKAHLETSPGDQAAQALDVDQYAKTHTVLVEQMITPLVSIAETEPGAAVSAFWQHLQKGHLEESPGTQVGDILNVDQYVKTHTVLVEHMSSPAFDAMAGTC